MAAKETFDVYMRMKASDDSDYCFQVDSESTFNDLFTVFNEIPVVFSPSIFYDRVPINFKVSHHPGILTRTGGILFAPESDKEKFLKEIPSLEAKIVDHVLPGQLIIPQFKSRDTLHYSVLAFFAVWLYTDLPEYITPTPGYTFTYGITHVICFILKDLLNKPENAVSFYNDIHQSTGHVGEWIYFLFHIVKLLMFYFILWAGLLNPYSWTKPSLEKLTRERLIEIGWTGIKRTNGIRYQDKYRDQLIKKEGSILNLFKMGQLPYIQQCVVPLTTGEGYDSTSKVSEKIENPFILNKEVLYQSFDDLIEEISELKDSRQQNEKLRNFRVYGNLNSESVVAKMAGKRFVEIDRQIEQDKEAKKLKESKKDK